MDIKDIYYWFESWYYRITETMERIIAYARLGYNCPDWDHVYLYEHIAFKLKRMEYVQEHSHHTNGSKYADQIKVARIALERLSEEYWITDEIIKEYDDKLRDYPKEVHDKIRRLGHHELYLQKQDLELFAKQFVKYSQGWWDVWMIIFFLGGMICPALIT